MAIDYSLYSQESLKSIRDNIQGQKTRQENEIKEHQDTIITLQITVEMLTNELDIISALIIEE